MKVFNIAHIAVLYRKISCNFRGHPKAQLTKVEGDLFEECEVSTGEIRLSAADLILCVH